MLARLAKLGLVLGISAVLLAGCAREPSLKVSLAETEKPGRTSSENWSCLGCKTPPSQERPGTAAQLSQLQRSDILRVAVASMTMPQETLTLYEELLRYVGDKLGKRVELVQRTTYREVTDLIEARLIDVAFVCSLPYALGHDKFGMELLAAPEVNGKAEYYSYIIVRADSGTSNFSELRGKTFAFMDPESNTGFLYPTYRLAQMGESPGKFFHAYVYTYAHDNSVRAVLEKIVEGAAVDSLVLDYMAAKDAAIASQIKIIERSPPFGIPPVVVHPALDPKLKQELRDVFLTMDKDERGKQVLNKMNFDRFTLTTDAAYDSIRNMYRVVQQAAGR